MSGEQQGAIGAAFDREVRSFVSEHVADAGAGAVVSWANMYEAYRAWATAVGIAMTPDRFNNSMLRLKYRHRDTADGTRCWAGVKLKQPPAKGQILAGERAGADPLADRYNLVLALRGVAGDLAYIGGRIVGQREATHHDIADAEKAVAEIRAALDHFKSRNPA